MDIEIEAVKAPTHETWAHALISAITGYEVEELLDYLPGADRVITRSFKDTVRALGFNSSDRFKKFDENTEKTCFIMLTHKRDKNGKQKSGRYPYAYYKGFVYSYDGYKYELNHFMSFFPDLRLTSMLEVWI